MHLKNLTVIDSSQDAVTLTFRDDDGVAHTLTIPSKSVRPVVEALMRILPHAEPNAKLAFAISSAKVMSGTRGVTLTDRAGLEIMLALEQNAARMLASCATEVVTAYGGLVH